jgi:hypothetical protein
MIQSDPFDAKPSILGNQTEVKLNIKIASKYGSNYTTIFYPIRTSKNIR